jgi:hypothetical protein
MLETCISTSMEKRTLVSLGNQRGIPASPKGVVNATRQCSTLRAPSEAL